MEVLEIITIGLNAIFDLISIGTILFGVFYALYHSRTLGKGSVDITDDYRVLTVQGNFTPIVLALGISLLLDVVQYFVVELLLGRIIPLCL